ncbi:MAG: VOC family protein [Acidobacteria bacterium]|nr:VOC family protein [Acidobacteriota bacterium]
MIACSFFGPGARFHHVGLAVDSIRAVSPGSKPRIEHAQKVSMAFVSLDGVTVELLEPFGENSPILRNLRAGVKLLHLCFEVTDLPAALVAAKAAGFHRISRPVETEFFPGRSVVWVHSLQYGLIELLEGPASLPGIAAIG